MSSDDVTTTIKDEGKKSSKPIMEKKRRARMNACLTELKSLLADVIEAEGAIHSKMEKADILETTVRHLKRLQSHTVQGNVSAKESLQRNKFRLGYSECINEVVKFLQSPNVAEIDIKSKLIAHLSKCTSRLRSADPDQLSGYQISAGSQGSVIYSKHSTIQPDDISLEQTLPQINNAKHATFQTQKEIHILPKVSNPSCINVINCETANTSLREIQKRIPEPGKDENNDVSCQSNSENSIKRSETDATLPPCTQDSKTILTSSTSKNTIQLNSCGNISFTNDPSQQTQTGIQFNHTISSFPASVLSGVQLIPATVSGREFAFVLPANITANLFAAVTTPNYVLPIYTQQSQPSPDVNDDPMYQSHLNSFTQPLNLGSNKDTNASNSEVFSQTKGSAFSTIISPSPSNCTMQSNTTNTGINPHRVSPYDVLYKRHIKCHASQLSSCNEQRDHNPHGDITNNDITEQVTNHSKGKRLLADPTPGCSRMITHYDRERDNKHNHEHIKQINHVWKPTPGCSGIGHCDTQKEPKNELTMNDEQHIDQDTTVWRPW